MSGLSPNIRLVAPDPDELPPGVEIDVSGTDDDMPGDRGEYDDAGNLIRIEHEDGSVTVSIDGRPLEKAGAKRALQWFDNLVEDLSEDELNRISSELLRGVTDDIESRRDWIEDRANGIKLLGLRIELPGLSGGADGAPVEGMSRVRHPLLLESVLRFQANARSELLPTDGPVKIRNDDNNADLGEDQLADALEKDMNHYLTVTASEYYPDTDRMLLMLGFGGTAFKKIYYCPLRNRPVSETVDAADLIVNNAATDLRNAKRITHRVMMRPSTVKRLQILDVYRDVELSTPQAQLLDSAQREKKVVEGVSSSSSNPEDRDREIYEIYCELNLKGFEHKHKRKVSGLEIPYCVTIDVTSTKILSITRNYDEDRAELPEAREVFAKFSFVPGFGFYDIGLLHILGNTTNAVTAAWREMLDAGMFASFPGFLISKSGSRQNTNVFRVPPGGGAVVDTAGLPINQAVMPLPYKEPSAALMTLIENMVATGQRVGGTSELQVGEGRADAPVGTTIALIDQAQKILNAVHKRLHSSQSTEFQLLAECFRDHPDSFWQRNKTPSYQWDQDTFLKALENRQLVPQADPNTSSQTQRTMKVIALKQLQAASPNLYNPVAVDMAALQAIGWSNPQQFMLPPDKATQPSAVIQKGIAEIEMKQKDLEIKKGEAQARIAKIEADIALDQKKFEAETSLSAFKQQADASISAHKIENDVENAKNTAKIEAAKILSGRDISGREQDIKTEDTISRERIQLVDVAQNLAVHPDSASLVEPLIAPAMKHVLMKQEEQDSKRRARNAPVVPGGVVPPRNGIN